MTELNPGEIRTFPAKDHKGNITKTITLNRTNRPYVFDLRDAYNDARSLEALNRGVEWYVTAIGELKIGFVVHDAALRAIHHER